MKKGILLSRLLLVIICLPFISAKGDEGMWLPQLLKQLNESDMRLNGLHLTAADLYNPDSVSLKDAIDLFGGGCTGEIISAKGLLLTNHHCGFGQIQEHSTLEKNYLNEGFWANSFEEEIPCPGLTVTFIREITDVTKIILAEISDTISEADR